ncbi:MAG: RNA 2',3'-cyclic phosphodiesterase [Nitrospirae bacterium]|jgi:RNA 2',3'-cyclic 3'-phosphodiesterase|nr:RNA 2',3'-cyclic phosphodiesterase [Nitrospirota bacterium]
MSLRCFIAIGITEPIKKDIGEIIGLLTKYDVDVKWVIPENIHITLKFLGNTPDVLLPKIKSSLSDIISYYKPFYIKIYGTGVFPNRKHPRVIWVGVKNTDILAKIKNGIEESMESLGYQKEDKEFNPHLTLGRVRSQKGIHNVIAELDNFKEKDFGTIRVEGIKMMKSDLKPGGAKYSCLYDIAMEDK